MAGKTVHSADDQDAPVLIRIKRSVDKLDAVMEGPSISTFVERGYTALFEAITAPENGNPALRERFRLPSFPKPLFSRHFAALGAAVLLLGGVSIPAIAGPGPFVEGLSTVTCVVGRAIGVSGPAKLETKVTGEVRGGTGARSSIEGSPTATQAGTPRSYPIVFSTPQQVPTTSAAIDPTPVVSPTYQPVSTISPSADPGTTDGQRGAQREGASSARPISPTPGSDSAPEGEDREDPGTVLPTPYVPSVPTAESTKTGDHDGEDRETPSPTPTAEPTTAGDHDGTVSPTPDAEPTTTNEEDGQHQDSVLPTTTDSSTTLPTPSSGQSIPTPYSGGNDAN